MIPQNFEYAAPATLEEALQLARERRRKPLAGGMSLIPLMKLRLAAPEQLIDIGRLHELNYIREDGRRAPHRRQHHASGNREFRRAARRMLRCSRKPRPASATSRCATWAPSAAASPMPIPRPIIRPPCSRWKRRSASRPRRANVPSSAADFFVDTFTTALEPGEIVLEVQVAARGPGRRLQVREGAPPGFRFRGRRRSRANSKERR